MPWEGVVDEWWLDLFADVCGQLQIDLTRRPFGPLLPAPKLGGGFCARPLSTTEAAAWLRSLLRGTRDWEGFRSHSLKATLLIWCARLGLDRDTGCSWTSLQYQGRKLYTPVIFKYCENTRSAGPVFPQLGLEPNHAGLASQSLFSLEESCAE